MAELTAARIGVGFGHGVRVSASGAVAVVVDWLADGDSKIEAWLVSDGEAGAAARLVGRWPRPAGASSVRWPSCGWVGEALRVAWQRDTGAGWLVTSASSGREYDEGAAVGDRATAFDVSGRLEVNRGQWSAQGVAGFVEGRWIGHDELRARYADVAGFRAWGISARGGWAVGNATIGPDAILAVGPDRRVWRVMEGIGFEPKIDDGPDGRIWVTASAPGRVLRWGAWAPSELTPWAPPVVEVLEAPTAAPAGTPIRGRRFFGVCAGEDHNGARHQVSPAPAGFVVHRKGVNPRGDTAVLQVTPEALRLTLEYDEDPHLITETRGGRALAFLRDDDAAGWVRRYPEGWLYRYHVADLAPRVSLRHPVAIQVVALYDQPFRFRDGGGQIFACEACVVVALREGRGPLVWRDGRPDGTGIAPVGGNTELNFFFDRVRPDGRPASEGQSGLGGWLGIERAGGPSPWSPWLRAATGPGFEAYAGPFTVAPFGDSGPGGGGGGGTGGGTGGTMKDQATFAREFAAVNAFYAAADGLQRPGGMVIDGACDIEAMQQWGYQLMAGGSVASILGQIRRSDEWRSKHPEGGGGGGGGGARPVWGGRLTRNRRALVAEGRERLILTLSMFNQPTKFEHVPEMFADDVAAAVEHGCDAGRVITLLDWPAPESDQLPTEPGHIDRLVACAEAMYAGGLRTDLCLFGASDFVDRGQRFYTIDHALEYAAAVCRAFVGREHLLVWVIVANEPGHPQIWRHGIEGLRRVRDVVKRILPGVLVGLGAGFRLDGRGGSVTGWGDEHDGTNFLPEFAPGCDIVTAHEDRGGTWRRNVRQGWIIARDTVADVVSYREEPIGPFNYPAGQGPNLNDAEKNGILATSTWAVGMAAHCFHGGAGIGVTNPVPGYGLWAPIRMQEAHGLAHVAAARAVLPAECPNWSRHNWQWPGNPFESLYEPTDADGGAPTRGHALVAPDGRFVRHEFGVDTGARLRSRVGATIAIYRRSDRVFVPVDERAIAAGQVLELAPASEYLILGRP